MALFKSIASVTVGKEGGSGTKIDGLRISFNVTATLTSEPNVSEIQIYNLSETTRAKFLKETGLKVWLYAGYQDDIGLELVYVGDITLVNFKYTAPDVITILQCGDGALALRDLRVSLSYAPGTSAQTAIKDISNRFNIPVRNTGFDASGVTFPNGFSYIGRAKGAMNHVTNICQANWSVQKNTIQVLNKNGHNNEKVILLSPETGLIGMPEKLEDKGFSADTINVIKGWKFVSLLQPKLIPGGRVQIKSQEVNGVFSIETVDHKGDTRGDDWTTTIEVAPNG